MQRTIGRRRFLTDSGRAAIGLTAVRCPSIEAAPSFDLVLKGASILDGTGGPAFAADVGVIGDAIGAVGSIDPGQGRRLLDVKGLLLCPGFVDIHTHSDTSILAYPTADSRVRQGITTEIGGNCGDSAAPLTGIGVAERRKALLDDEGIEADWTDVASYCARLERTQISTNQALLLGQGTLRANLIGEANRRLGGAELKSLLQAVEEGMDQGAFGLSTGLEYTPGRYTPTEEIVELCRVVARRGGLYASHMRNEEAALLEAVNETIDVGRETGVRVEISHLKAAGRRNWSKQRAALDLLEAARRQGIEVFADAYPYTAYSTGLTIFLADWALEGGTGALLARLRNGPERARIREEALAKIESDPGSGDLIVISRVRTDRNQFVIGLNLVEVGNRWQVEPIDALLRLVEEEEGSVSFVGHGMSPQNVEMVLRHPLVMIGSDGNSMAPVGKAAASRPHPRSYGSHARVLAYYAIERAVFDLPTAVRKMTAMPAAHVGIKDRGRIGRGLKADIVVFDAARIKDRATFENPHQYAAGIVHVLVNGIPVVEDGAHTGARPGRMLRRS